MMKKLLCMLFGAALIVSLAVGGAIASDASRPLNLSILAAMTSLDPYGTVNLQDRFVMEQFNEGLFKRNEATNQIEPRIAESWDISEDGLTYTFHLRHDVKFHNGDTLKASDVVFSYKRGMTNPRMKSSFIILEDVSAPDDYTFVMKLKSPNSAILSTLSPYAMVLSEREVTAAGEKFGTAPHTAACGPYKIGRVDSLDSYWELDAFEDFYKGAPAIKKITYKPIAEASAGLIAFESGELDWYIAPIANWDDLAANTDINSELVTSNHQSYLILNYTKGELDDDNLRKAIAYAIDKDACNDVAYAGLATVADYMYSPKMSIAAPDHGNIYKYDPELAKQYLAKSKMPNGGKLSGTIQCSAGGYFAKMAVVIQQNLADIGLEIEVATMQSATNMDIMRKNEHFIGVSGGNCGGDYDGIRSWYHSTSNSFAKFTYNDKFKSDWIDQKLEEGAALLDVEARRKVYAELDSYVVDCCVYIPIFHKVQPYVWTKDLVIPVNYGNYPRVYEWSWAK